MEQPSFLHKSGRAIMKTATSTKPGTRCLCLGAPRDRACARRERWGRWSFRAAARGGIGCRRSYARSGLVPLRLTYLVGRSAGPCLRSQGTLGQVELSRCRARGIIGSRRSYARSGPVPLRLTYFGGAPRSWGRSRICGICGTDPDGRPRGRLCRRAIVSTSCVAGEGLSVSVGGGCEGSVEWGHVLPRVVCAGGAVDGPGSHRAGVGCYARGGAT